MPGVQGVGVLEQGAGAGTAVWFATDAGMTAGDGSLAEAAVVDEADTVPLPDGVGHAAAAALGLSAVAAWMALTWKARLRPGERVLVLGAGGAVGQVAVQVAAVLGRRGRRGEPARVRTPPRPRPRRHRDGGPVRWRRGRAGVPAARGRAGRSTSSSTRCAGRRRPRHCACSATAAGWSTSAPAADPTATFSSAALRSGSHSILGYTNNALSREQRADALTRVLELAAAGRCGVGHETVGLHAVAEAWTRAGSAPDDRLVVVPAAPATPEDR